MNVGQLAQHFQKNLITGYDEAEIHAIFLVVIEHFLNLKRTDFILKKDQLLSADTLAQVDEVLQRLIDGEPIQYILGETEFYGLTFKVSPAVLIPRPETEELVEWVLETANDLSAITTSLPQARKNQLPTLIDIGTGSGCIAISLKKNLPNVTVLALDVAEDSLWVAKENALLNQVEIEFIHDDILHPNLELPNQCALIVSNPPYIKIDEQIEMHHNVLANEPHLALFVSNEKPLIFYEAIADFAKVNLIEKGFLFFEINEYLGKETMELLKNKGFEDIELKKDMQGKDRMIRCRKIN